MLCDVFDDAQSQLDEVEIFLQKTIFTAIDDLENTLMDFNYFAVDCDYFGMVKIQEQEDKVLAQLVDIKSSNNDINISACFDDNENNLQNLPWLSIDKMRACTAATMLEAPEIIRDLQYVVDVTYTNVGAIQFELAACNSDDCLTSVIEQLTEKSSQLSEKIQMEVLKGAASLVELKVTAQACQDDNVEAYINTTDAIVQTITDCMDNL